MLRYAIIFLILSLVAGAFGLSNVSALAKKISLILFALFLAGFLILLAFAWLVTGALAPSAPMPTTTSLLEQLSYGSLVLAGSGFRLAGRYSTNQAR